MSEETKTGKEVEQELLEEASQESQQEVQQMSPEAVSSQLLMIYTPIYENLVNGLSANAMRRLLKKLVEFPLNEKEMKATSEQEQQTFAIGTRLLEAKFVLIMQTYNENAQKMQEDAEKAAEAQEKEEK